MKHFEVKNLSKELDILLQYIVDAKITNAYLNYGLIRNTKILTKAAALIDEATPARLKELETTIYRKGMEEFEKLEKEDPTLTELPEGVKQNRTFDLGYVAAEQEVKDERDILVKEYNNFLNLESDVELYYIKLDGIKDIDMEIKYWGVLDNFIKEP